MNQLNILLAGNLTDPKVVVVCDVPPEPAHRRGKVMTNPAMALFKHYVMRAGFEQGDFAFITPAPPIPEEAAMSDSKTNEFLDTHREEFLSQFREVSRKASMVMYLGRFAGRQFMGRSVKITQARGQIHPVKGVALGREIPVLPLLSPGNVLRRPEVEEIFETDVLLGGEFKKSNWSVAKYEGGRMNGDYKWTLDLSEELDLDNPPSALGVDTETLGLNWYRGIKVLVVQLSWKKGQGVVVPVDIDYFNNPELRGDSTSHLPSLTHRGRLRIIHQLRKLLSNPKVAVVGHNLKFDLHALATLGVSVANWAHDSMQLAFVADDNMQSKGLDDCVRRWIPTMAGYADEFNKRTDKSRMDLVPHDDMMHYAAGDADVARRLCFTLVKVGKEDVGNYRCYEKIQMPSLRMFYRMEREGIRVDQDALFHLGQVATAQEKELKATLLSQVPAKLRLRHLNDPKQEGKHPSDVITFSRADFKIDVLFSKKSEGGRGLKPRVFTNGTKMLPPEERIPSTSANDHLPYFDNDDFVVDLIDYLKLQKLRTTYIGDPARTEYKGVKLLKSGKKYQKAAQDVIEKKGIDVAFVPSIEGNPAGEGTEWARAALRDDCSLVVDANGRPWWEDKVEPTGFWKYLSPTSNIHPSFMLHRTVTGRSSSASPNGQNIPKRGSTPRLDELVTAYRSIFKAKPGHVLIEADLSQAELRLVAWMAMEETMLAVYQSGGDIHATTAAKTMGLTIEQFKALPSEEKKMARFRAKAVNFGFIYGMWWRKFQSYAKTDYGLNLTENQAEKARTDFFELYWGLEDWHTGMKNFAKKHGYVRSLHGALRRLPAVYSDDEKVQQEAQRQAINSPIQRFASDLGLIGMFRFGEKCPWDKMHPIGFIHDAVIVEAKIEHAEEAMQAIRWFLETPPLSEWFGITPPLPLLSDVSVGTSLGDMVERDDIQTVQPLWATI